MKHENKRTISIDDLLRLKRAERPPAEFWGEFDRRLRAKQLAALVGRRPWWQNLPHVFSGFRRYHLPLGAATILALTFVSIRDNPATPAARNEVAASAVPTVGAMPSGVASTSRIEVGAAEFVTAGPTGSESSRPLESQVNDPQIAVAAVTPGEFSRMIPLLGVAAGEPGESAPTRLPRFVDSALAATAAAEPVVSRSQLSLNSRFETRALPARAAIEPLQQISTPSERRGTRILMAMVSMATVENAMRTTERAASRLSEDQLYDQIHRIGARGAGVNVKF